LIKLVKLIEFIGLIELIEFIYQILTCGPFYYRLIGLLKKRSVSRTFISTTTYTSRPYFGTYF